MPQRFQFSLRTGMKGLAVLLAWGALSGCNQTAVPPLPRTMTTHGYTFVSDEGEDLSVEGHRNSVRAADGTETELDEDISIHCGTRKARIVNGRLTAGGNDCGPVKPGDRISFTKSDGLSVNGVNR